MGSLHELKAYIRFRLEQLGAENAHHRFEQLCFELARRRVCSNIIPATGPVSAGGDQGRDAESIRTHLKKVGLGNSAFVGLTTDHPIVIACTLRHKTKVKGKIKADVQIIVRSGRSVSDIHYFCSADIAAATRHDLENWAKTNHAVDLHIRDGQAISRDLADSDTFHIAMEFLSVPADMYPEPVPNLIDSWYRQLLERWNTTNPKQLTFATFSELRSATYHATFEPDLQHDLPFWLEKLLLFESNDVSPILQRRAKYERAVASIRGLGTLNGREDEIRAYFADVIDQGETSDFQDAAVLLTYMFGAVANHVVLFDDIEVLGWHEELVKEVEQGLQQAQTPNSKCDWLETLGYLQLTGPNQNSHGRPLRTVQTWLRLTDLVEYAPLFPLERFANRLTAMIPLIADASEFDLLTGRVDQLLDKRFGKFAAAEKCRDRAMAFYEQGRILRAISELHQAKVHWFAKETLRGSVLAMMFISRCYADLGLLYASKYYALAASWVAIHAQDSDILRLTPQAVFQAAQAEYRLGNWIGWFRLADFGIRALLQFASDPGDLDANPELEETCLYCAAVIGATEFLDDNLASAIQEVTCNWGIGVLVDEFMPGAREPWTGQDQATVRSILDNKLGVRAFGDLLASREAVWHELGLRWRVHWPNDYQTTIAAEEFIATLQVAVTDFSKHDLLLLKTEVDISVSVGDVDFPKVAAVPSNSGREWKVVLPRSRSGEKENGDWKEAGLLGAAIQMIREVSLLPSPQFMAAFQDVMEGGFMAKVFVARRYGDLYREIIPENALLHDIEANEHVLAIRPAATPEPHAELSWVDRPAPSYSQEDSFDAIARRYSTIQAQLPVTLTRLAQSKDFQDSVALLRNEGWRDWHILLAVRNVALNLRLQQMMPSAEFLPRNPGPDDYDALKIKALEASNDLDVESLSPMDLSGFTLEKIREGLKISMGSTLIGLGLECHQETPDLPAIEEFLARRYMYWEDDIEHTDPFELAGQSIFIPKF